MRITLAVAVACLTLGAIAAADEAAAAIRRQTEIPAQGLGSALTSLAKEFDFQVLYRTEVVGTLRTQGVSGAMTAAEALEHVLGGTGLTYKYLDDKTVTILPVAATAPRAGAVAPKSSDTAGDNDAKEGKRGSSEEFRVAETPQGTHSSTPPVAGTSAARRERQEGTNPPATLEEVIVTAQKRSERLQDVPVPVTAINAEALINNNQLRLQDYYTNVPGFTVAPASKQTTQILALRGLTTGVGSPTVGILIDDVPYGSSTALGGGQGIPDLDPGDLARIEVLRGPQGTLYGTSSIGGLAKFVTVDPSTSAVSGRLQAGTTSIYNGDGLGYNARGSINVPLSDTWAVRASAFTRKEAGFIDNPGRNLKGVNEETTNGGRLAAMWKPSDDLSLKLSAMYQKAKNTGVNAVDVLPNLGDLQQAYVLNNPQEKTVQAYSAILNAKLAGDATLTSLSGYNIASFSDRSDGSGLYAGSLASFFGGNQGILQTDQSKTKKFSQELRLSMPLGAHFDWLLGGFYTKEDTDFFLNVLGVNEATQQPVGALVLSTFPTTYREYSGFTDLTYKITERFDVQLGGRYSKIKETAVETDDGVIYNTYFVRPPRANPAVTPGKSDSSSFTYLLTPRLRLTPDLMAYARFSSGYRAGGVNITQDPSVPSGFGPDKTQNYELGLKGDFFDHRLSVDASTYYIDWKDIQLFLVNPARAGYFANGGKASSKGVELAVESKPVRGLTIGGWVAFNQAQLKDNIRTIDPSVLPLALQVQGLAGAPLPYSTRFSGKLGMQQNFPLTSRVTGFAGVDVSYVGEREISFQRGTLDRPVLPAYAQTDVRAGVQYETWSVNLFVNNATDRRGELTKGIDAGLPWSVQYIQPRTVGLSLAKTF